MKGSEESTGSGSAAYHGIETPAASSGFRRLLSSIGQRLRPSPYRTSHRNLLFTSVGDRSSFDTNWLGPDQNFDVFVVYYGDDDDRFLRYKDQVRWIARRKGSKYQNFAAFYHAHPEIVRAYRRFFILDDDLEFHGGVAAINRMFEISREHGLDICGPSVTPDGKVSYDVTEHDARCELAYTNFVEVYAQLFSRRALDKLMKWLHPDLIGWGIDFLAVWANGMDRRDSYAVVHAVACRNPHDHDKDDRRELDLLPGAGRRQETWENYARKIGCPEAYELVEYERVEAS